MDANRRYVFGYPEILPASWTPRAGFRFNPETRRLVIDQLNDENTRLIIHELTLNPSYLEELSNPAELLSQVEAEAALFKSSFERMMSNPDLQKGLIYNYVRSLHKAIELLKSLLAADAAKDSEEVVYYYPNLKVPKSTPDVRVEPTAPPAKPDSTKHPEVEKCTVILSDTELSNLFLGWNLQDKSKALIIGFIRNKIESKPKDLDTIPLKGNQWVFAIDCATTMILIRSLFERIDKGCGCDNSLTKELLAELARVNKALNLDSVPTGKDERSWRIYKECLHLIIYLVEGNLSLEVIKEFEKRKKVHLMNTFYSDKIRRRDVDTLYHQFFAENHRLAYVKPIPRDKILSATVSPQAERKAKKSLRDRLARGSYT
jgi:hypothetical protein